MFYCDIWLIDGLEKEITWKNFYSKVMESAPLGEMGPLLLSLALAAGTVAFGVLILRGLFEAVKGLVNKSKGD